MSILRTFRNNGSVWNVRTETTYLFIAIVILVCGCGSSQGSFDPPRTLIGQIMVVGNEPFARLAVQVGHEKVYLITCDETMSKFLLSNQGRIAKLVYSEIRETNRGDEVRVVQGLIISN
jgi:hypothetical protein